MLLSAVACNSGKTGAKVDGADSTAVAEAESLLILRHSFLQRQALTLSATSSASSSDQ